MFELIKQGVVSVLQADVALNRENVPAAELACQSCFDRGQPKLVIDMSGIPLLDSRGLEWLLEKHRQAQTRGGRLALANPAPLCMDILRVTAVAEECGFYDDVLTAVGSYNQ